MQQKQQKEQQQTEIINAETEAQKKVIDSKAKAKKRLQEGYTYQQERGFNVAEKMAENEAVGEFNNMGIGIGTMAGVGGAVGNMIGGMMTETVKSTAIPQANNKQTGKFCENCGIMNVIKLEQDNI